MNPTDEEFVIFCQPTARLVGPSGDGCHVEVDGHWFAYGNIPENAWKSARSRLESEVRR